MVIYAEAKFLVLTNTPRLCEMLTLGKAGRRVDRNFLYHLSSASEKSKKYFKMKSTTYILEGSSTVSSEWLSRQIYTSWSTLYFIHSRV